jgi:hypothetical protein
MKMKRKSLSFDEKDDGISSSTELSLWGSYGSKFGTKETPTAILSRSVGSSSKMSLGLMRMLSYLK